MIRSSCKSGGQGAVTPNPPNHEAPTRRCNMAEHDSTDAGSMGATTKRTEFHRGLLEVREGIPVEYALERASCLMACALGVSGDSIEDNNGDTQWALNHLIEMSKAFLDAAISGQMRHAPEAD